ncbi:MAG: helix-turn-helix domain-containing protein [Hyphomicrobiaceae bacterium]
MFGAVRKTEDRIVSRTEVEAQRKDIDAQLGRRLKLRRTLLGLTQEQLANECGISYQQIHKYETGQSKMSTTRLIEFGRVLETPVAWFFDGLEANDLGTQIEAGSGQLDNSTARLITVAQRIKSKKRLRQLVEFAKILADEED